MTGTAIAVTIAAALVIIIALVNWWHYRLLRDGTWHCTGSEMRRWSGGRWERRPMTEAESDDWHDGWTW